MRRNRKKTFDHAVLRRDLPTLPPEKPGKRTPRKAIQHRCFFQPGPSRLIDAITHSSKLTRTMRISRDRYPDTRLICQTSILG
jgi:hypothetical protein